MLGDKFSLGKLLKGAKQIQSMMEQAKEDLEKIEVTGESGAGAVTILMNGCRQVIQVKLDDTILQESKEIIEELIAAAVNNAVNKVDEITKAKMMDASKLFGITPATETEDKE